MADKRDNKRSVNYDFNKQKDPMRRMGEDEYANLPQRPMYMSFDDKNEYRDGVINSLSSRVREISDISENQR